MREPIDPPVHLLAAFQSAFDDAAQIVARAPERDLWAAARVISSPIWTLMIISEAQRTAFTYQSAKRKQTVLHRPLPKWARYASGVCCMIAESPPGMEVVFVGHEPAGPRRHHAVGLAFAALIREACALNWNDNDLHDLLDQVRRIYL